MTNRTRVTANVKNEIVNIAPSSEGKAILSSLLLLRLLIGAIAFTSLVSANTIDFHFNVIVKISKVLFEYC